MGEGGGGIEPENTTSADWKVIEFSHRWENPTVGGEQRKYHLCSAEKCHCFNKNSNCLEVGLNNETAAAPCNWLYLLYNLT